MADPVDVRLYLCRFRHVVVDGLEGLLAFGYLVEDLLARRGSVSQRGQFFVVRKRDRRDLAGDMLQELFLFGQCATFSSLAVTWACSHSRFSRDFSPGSEMADLSESICVFASSICFLSHPKGRGSTHQAVSVPVFCRSIQ